MMDKARAVWQTPAFATAVLVLCVVGFNNWVLALIFNHKLLFQTGSVSELSATTQPHAWVFRSLDIAVGIFMIILALLLARRMNIRSKLRSWLIITMLVVGVANSVDGLLPLRCSETLSAECVETVNLSVSHFTIPSHGYSSVVISVGYFVLPLAGYLYARQARLRMFMIVSALAIAASVVSLISAIAGYLITQSFSERALGPSQELQMLLLGLWFVSWYIAVFAKEDKDNKFKNPVKSLKL